MEGIIVLYVLFIALGPRRVVRWWYGLQAALARMQGRPPPPRRRWGWLRAAEAFEHSTAIGWTCIVVGLGLAFAARFLWPDLMLPLTVVAMALLFVGPWLI